MENLDHEKDCILDALLVDHEKMKKVHARMFDLIDRLRSFSEIAEIISKEFEMTEYEYMFFGYMLFDIMTKYKKKKNVVVVGNINLKGSC